MLDIDLRFRSEVFLTRLDKRKLVERMFYSKEIDLRGWTASTPGRTRVGHQQTASFTPAVS